MLNEIGTWDFEGADWDNPDPLDIRYWKCLIEAIQERTILRGNGTYENVNILRQLGYNTPLSKDIVVYLYSTLRKIAYYNQVDMADFASIGGSDVYEINTARILSPAPSYYYSNKNIWYIEGTGELVYSINIDIPISPRNSWLTDGRLKALLGSSLVPVQSIVVDIQDDNNVKLCKSITVTFEAPLPKRWKCYISLPVYDMLALDTADRFWVNGLLCYDSNGQLLSDKTYKDIRDGDPTINKFFITDGNIEGYIKDHSDLTNVLSALGTNFNKDSLSKFLSYYKNWITYIASVDNNYAKASVLYVKNNSSLIWQFRYDSPTGNICAYRMATERKFNMSYNTTLYHDTEGNIKSYDDWIGHLGNFDEGCTCTVNETGETITLTKQQYDNYQDSILVHYGYKASMFTMPEPDYIDNKYQYTINIASLYGNGTPYQVLLGYPTNDSVQLNIEYISSSTYFDGYAAIPFVYQHASYYHYQTASPTVIISADYQTITITSNVELKNASICAIGFWSIPAVSPELYSNFVAIDTWTTFEYKGVWTADSWSSEATDNPDFPEKPWEVGSAGSFESAWNVPESYYFYNTSTNKQLYSSLWYPITIGYATNLTIGRSTFYKTQFDYNPDTGESFIAEHLSDVSFSPYMTPRMLICSGLPFQVVLKKALVQDYLDSTTEVVSVEQTWTAQLQSMYDGSNNMYVIDTMVTIGSNEQPQQSIVHHYGTEDSVDDRSFWYARYWFELYYEDNTDIQNGSRIADCIVNRIPGTLKYQ